MTTHQHLARRPLAAAVVPSAYATTPGVHWRRTLAAGHPARVDLDLSQPVPATTVRAATAGASAAHKSAPAGVSRTANGRTEASAGWVAGTNHPHSVSAPAGSGRDGLAVALDRCTSTGSSGTLIHLRLDALPRWLDLAHAQDPSPADNAAASYGEAGSAAAAYRPHQAASDMLDALTQRLRGALPANSVVDIDACGQAWVVVDPVSSSAAALGWARHLMQLLAPGAHRRMAALPQVVAGAALPGVRWPELALDVSAGLCLFPADAAQVDQVRAAACAASAQARVQGRGRCQLYSGDITARSRHDLNEGRALAAALGSGGLELSLQGRADLRSGALCAAQVQLGWPRRIGDRADGSAGPVQTSGADSSAKPAASAAPAGSERRVAARDLGGLFGAGLEALARQHGLAEALGREMLGRTCAQLRRWRDDGYAVPQLSLRLPAELLAHGDFAIELLDLLGRHRLPGSCLALELGQDSLAALRDDTAHLLDSAGISLIADAARVDLLSLTACRHLRVSALVVDLADVGDITVSLSPARTTVLALAGLAHGMAMRLVVRSVDHEAELDVLMGTDCDDYQGAVLARPLPARIWSRLLAEPAAVVRPGAAAQPLAPTCVDAVGAL
jgi:EAL domain-containing protein (putative c-di-GMP-specific phosphodiesterase class I)